MCQSPNCFDHTARTGLHFIRKLCTKSWFDVCRQEITIKVSHWVNLLRRLSWVLLFVLYLKSYILLCVDYCDVVWDWCSKQDSNRLQTLFNYGCCIALPCPRLSSSSALWKDLGLSSLVSHSKLHLAELRFKCHNSLAPPYLVITSLFNTLSHKCSTLKRNL